MEKKKMTKASSSYLDVGRPHRCTSTFYDGDVDVFDCDGCIMVSSMWCFFFDLFLFVWFLFSVLLRKMEWEGDNSMFLVCFFFGLGSLTFSFSYLLILPFCCFTFPLELSVIYYIILFCSDDDHDTVGMWTVLFAWCKAIIALWSILLCSKPKWFPPLSPSRFLSFLYQQPWKIIA